MRIGRAMSLYRLFRSAASSFSRWSRQLAVHQLDCVEDCGWKDCNLSRRHSEVVIISGRETGELLNETDGG